MLHTIYPLKRQNLPMEAHEPSLGRSDLKCHFLQGDRVVSFNHALAGCF